MQQHIFRANLKQLSNNSMIQIAGGYAPDRMRISQKMLTIVRELFSRSILE